MRSILTDLTLIACIITYAIEPCLSRETEYEFLTEDLSFKTIYRIQAYLNSRPAYINYIYERYSQPSSASIWQSRHHWDGKQFVETDLRQFLYSRREDKIVEIDRCASKGLRLNDDFSLFENGASISYSSPDYIQDSTMSNEVIDSIKLVPSNTPFDSIMISNEIEGKVPKVPLNYDNFMSDDCLIKVNSKLRHIKGVSRLLHLIECRRREFRLHGPMDMRGRASRIYVAKTIGAVRSDKYNITKLMVTYPEEALMKSKDFQTDSSKLPSGVVPNTIRFYYDSEYKGESKSWLFAINLFQFETLSETMSRNQDLNDHPVSSHSVYMLPPAHGVVELLPTKIRLPEKKVSGRSFSFNAKVTGTKMPFKQSLELLAFYDAEQKVLASQLSQVITGSSQPGAYARLHTRTVYDRRSGLKFHLMDSNHQYNVPAAHRPDRQDNWASCATTELADEEASLDRGLYDGLDAAESGTHLGRAIVRGVECDVYEKRLYRMPLWLGIESSWSRDAHTESGDLVFASLYVAASDSEQVNDVTDRRPLRLELNILSRGRIKTWQDSLEGMKLVNKIQIEFYGFQWTSEGFENAFGVNLLALCRQECIAAQRRVQMNILFKPFNHMDQSEREHNEYDDWMRRLRDDTEFRNGLISEALFESYRIAPIQQTDLKTEWIDFGNLNLRVELGVNELPRITLSVQKMMDASDLTPRSGGSTGRDTVWSPWINGATSVSMQECVWRAAHKLVADDDAVSIDNDYSRQDDDPTLSKKIMYCPRTLHCVLGDDDWTNISLANRESIVIKDTLKTIVDHSNDSIDNRCYIFVVSKRTVTNRMYGSTHTTLVEWLRSGQDILLDKSIELKQVNEERSLKLRTAKLRVSKIYSDYGNYESDHLPLRGFGYDPGAGADREVDSNYLYKPMITKQLANCEQTCLMHHDCRSFSACHYASVDFDNDNDNDFGSSGDGDWDNDNESAGKSKIVCVFTSLNWTDPVKLKELSRLTTTDGRDGVISRRINGKRILELNVWPSIDDQEEEEDDNDDGGQAESTDRTIRIRLRRSPMCSLHARSHWDLYRSTSQNITDVKSSNTMLLASNYDQCARFCLTRAHLLTLLLKRSGKQLPDATRHDFLKPGQYSGREFSCRSFRYSPLLGYCILSPELDYTSDSSHIDSIAGQKHLSRLELEWVEARKGMQKLATVSNFAYFNSYALNYDRLFVAQERTRIELIGAQSDEIVLQRSLDRKVTWNECADECVRSRYCRSFDTRLTRTDASGQLEAAVGAAAKGECVLNALAAFDLHVAAGGSGGTINKLAKLLREEVEDGGASSGDNGNKQHAHYWHHHEPTELLLYAISDPVERPVLAGDKYSNGNANDRATGEISNSNSSSSSSKQTSVYINLSSARDHWRLASSSLVSSNSNSNSNTVTNNNDRDNSMSSSNWTPLALAGVVAMAIVILVLIVIGFYSATNTNRVGSSAMRACHSGACNLLLTTKLTFERLCRRIMNAVK